MRSPQVFALTIALVLSAALAAAAADDSSNNDLQLLSGENDGSPRLGPAAAAGGGMMDSDVPADDNDDADLDLEALLGGSDDLVDDVEGSTPSYTVTRADWKRYYENQVDRNWGRLMKDIGRSLVGGSGSAAIAGSYKHTPSNYIANEFVLGVYYPRWGSDCARATYGKGFATWRFAVFYQQAVDAVLNSFGSAWWDETANSAAIVRRKAAATAIRATFPATTLSGPVWNGFYADIDKWKADRQKNGNYGYCDDTCQAYWTNLWNRKVRKNLSDLMAKPVPATNAANIQASCAQKWSKVVDHCTLEQFLHEPCRFSLPCAFEAAKKFAFASYTALPYTTTTSQSSSLLRDAVDTFACAQATFSAVRAMYADNRILCPGIAKCPADSPAVKFYTGLWAVEKERVQAENERLEKQKKDAENGVTHISDIVDLAEGDTAGGYPSCSSVGSICADCPVSSCTSCGDALYGC